MKEAYLPAGRQASVIARQFCQDATLSIDLVYTIDDSIITIAAMRKEFTNGVLGAVLVVVVAIAILEAVTIGILIGAS